MVNPGLAQVNLERLPPVPCPLPQNRVGGIGQIRNLQCDHGTILALVPCRRDGESGRSLTRKVDQ